MSKPFYWEAESDRDNTLTVATTKTHVIISVSDLQAVGSYNQGVELTANLTLDEAKALRDYLIKNLKS